MEVLQRQVRRVRRRLTLQRFLGVLSWCWFATLMAAAALIAADKFYPLGVQPWAWVAAAVGLGAIAALFWTFVTRRSYLEAALEIDRRFGLKERVSSTLALDSAERESPAGRALTDDAVRRVERLHMADQFRLKFNRWALLPLAPAVAAFLVAMFLNPALGDNKAGGSVQSTVQRKQVKNSTTALQRKLIDHRKKAREDGLKDAELLFKKLEQGSKKLAEAKTADRKQAMIKLNDLAKDLEKRREQLGGGEKLKNQLNQLKDIQKGPGDKLAEALRQGDFKQAQNELKKLRDQLEQGKLDEKSKAELSKQLQQMEEKLRQMAQNHQQKQSELEKQIAEKRAAGQSKEADRLQRQLDKMSKQSQQMKQLEKMAEKLGQCSECMQQGDKAAAMAALDSMQAELSQLQEQLDEMAMLDEAMDQINQAMDSMNCKQCKGMGCKACMGGGDGDGMGDGLGEGQGQGARPEEKGNTGFYDTKVKQKLGKGAAVVTDFVEGPNVKGQVEQEIKTQFDSARTGDADPLTDQRLPRGYREHSRKYFDSLREGR
ncbi:MAG: hypothetical protein WD403_14710 [Pirellulales bacterium]